MTFAATTGNTYFFSFCSTHGGSASFDTEITINNATPATVGGAFATSYNNDLCGTSSLLAWSPSSDGTYRVLVSRRTCQSTNAVSTLAYMAIPNASNFATWLGLTDTDWNVNTNWFNRGATGYPSLAQPTSTRNVHIPGASGRQPTISTANETCLDLNIYGAATTLTIGTGPTDAISTIEINDDFYNEGNLRHNATVYISMYGASGTISGSGNFYAGTICPLKFKAGANYTLGALAGNHLRASHIYIETGADATLNIGANKLSTNWFFQEGIFNQNTGTLEIAGRNSAASPSGTYSGTTWQSVNSNELNPFITPAKFNAGTGTTSFNSGEFTDTHHYTINGQWIPPANYHHLKIRANNGFRTMVGNGSSTISCSGGLTIENPSTAGGEIYTQSPINVTGNTGIGATGNAFTMYLRNKITGTGGAFSMGSATNLKILYSDATSPAIDGYGNAFTFGGTIEYNSSGTQQIMGSTYNNLIISGAGTRNLTANTTITGNLTLNNGTLDPTASNFNIDLKGNWENNGATYTLRGNTLTFSGTNAQNITSTSANSSTENFFSLLNLAIPDNNLTYSTSTFAVPTGTYTRASGFLLDIEHTYNSDVDVVLQTPAPTVYDLMSDKGGTGNNQNAVFLSNTGSVLPITNVELTGNYQATQDFTAYAGTMAGNWIVGYRDDGASDVGRVRSFQLNMLKTGVSNATQAFGNVVVNNTSATGVNISNDISIGSSHTLTLTDGVIGTGANKVVLLNTSAASLVAGAGNGAFGNSFINGTLQRGITANTDTYEFPLGNGIASSNLRRASITNNNLATISTLTGNFNNTVTGTNPLDPAKAVDFGTVY